MYNMLDSKLKKIIDKYKKIYLDNSISGITINHIVIYSSRVYI